MPAKRKRAKPPVGDTKAKPKRPPYTVIRDTREKEGQGYTFSPSASCLGTVRSKLDTGDYSLEGYQHLFTIERKGSPSEFVGNLYQPRFRAELERMRAIPHPVVLLEFDYEDLHLWHLRHPKIKRVPILWTIKGAIAAKFWETSLLYPHVHFIFAGLFGKEACSSLFKRTVEQYEPRPA